LNIDLDRFLDRPYNLYLHVDVDVGVFKELLAIMKPKPVTSRLVAAISVESGCVSTPKETCYDISVGALYWNGHKVTNPNEIAEFLDPGFGVLTLYGKHTCVLAPEWKA
jgi:hypothetical protein